jgi:hypothetical protein
VKEHFRPCDALSRNLPKLLQKLEIIVGHCLAHAWRRFVELTPDFPETCQFVLESLGEESLSEVYGNDAAAQEQVSARIHGSSLERRLSTAHSSSLPNLEALVRVGTAAAAVPEGPEPP